MVSRVEATSNGRAPVPPKEHCRERSDFEPAVLRCEGADVINPHGILYQPDPAWILAPSKAEQTISHTGRPHGG